MKTYKFTDKCVVAAFSFKEASALYEWVKNGHYGVKKSKTLLNAEAKLLHAIEIESYRLTRDAYHQDQKEEGNG